MKKTKVTKISNSNHPTFHAITKTVVDCWRHYFDISSIDGLNLLAGYTNNSLGGRVRQMLLFLTIFIITCYLCGNQLAHYLAYELKTQTTYILRENLTFPTISFANQNRFRKSVAGGNDVLMYYLTADILLAETDFNEKFSRFVDKVSKFFTHC